MTDPTKTLFEQGVAFLKEKDVKNPRPILGKWRSKHGNEKTLGALQSAMAADASDPIAYITKALAEPKNSDIIQQTIDEIHAARS